MNIGNLGGAPPIQTIHLLKDADIIMGRNLLYNNPLKLPPIPTKIF